MARTSNRRAPPLSAKLLAAGGVYLAAPMLLLVPIALIAHIVRRSNGRSISAFSHWLIECYSELANISAGPLFIVLLAQLALGK